MVRKHYGPTISHAPRAILMNIIDSNCDRIYAQPISPNDMNLV